MKPGKRLRSMFHYAWVCGACKQSGTVTVPTPDLMRQTMMQSHFAANPKCKTPRLSMK